MGLPDISDDFYVPTRDELVDRHKRDQLLLNPELDVTSGQPDMDARLAADTVGPIHANASYIANGINEDDATGDQLDRVGERKGVPRGKPRGSSGYVTVDAGTGGGQIVAGRHQLQNKQTKLRYEFAETKHVDNGTPVRVRALDTGPNTDLPPGTILSLTNPPPGVGQQATVVAQSNGRGLTGGADKESDGAYLERIRAHNQSPPAGDNDSEVSEALTGAPDVPIEQPFLYPGFRGPGSCGVTFTVLAPKLGASRIPTDAQVQSAFDWIVAQLPGDASYFPFVPISQALVVAFAVSWATGGWADATPWPAAYAIGVDVFGTSGPLSFTLNGGAVAPVAGNTLAFWDNANGVFQRKTIGSVTGPGPWVVTCTTQNGASDTTYTPFIGQRVAPWSDNLAKVPTSVLTYLATLGPGECFALVGSFMEGRRRKRTPKAPKQWPFTVGDRITVELSALPEIADAVNLAGVGATVTPTVPPKMLELSDLVIFPA